MRAEDAAGRIVQASPFRPADAERVADFVDQGAGDLLGCVIDQIFGVELHPAVTNSVVLERLVRSGDNRAGFGEYAEPDDNGVTRFDEMVPEIAGGAGREFEPIAEVAVLLTALLLGYSPPLLAVLGQPEILSRPCVALVGSRNASAAGAKMTGDTARGQRVFAQCLTCHSKDAGVNRTGPSLHGIIGRKAGTVPNFRYSDANKNSGITWTEQELFTYLENPKAKIPGTIMAFVGLRNPQQRADVIAYLKTEAAN